MLTAPNNLYKNMKRSGKTFKHITTGNEFQGHIVGREDKGLIDLTKTRRKNTQEIP